MPEPPPKVAPGPNPALLLAVATLAARRAGDHAAGQTLRRRETLEVLRHDIKLALDVECQLIAAETIAEAFPGHGLLGEEGAVAAPSYRWNWVVDPIDGTVNFSHGQSRWCCAVAARYEEQVLAAAVYAPDLGLLFEAHAAGPALCNGSPIAPSLEERLERALVFTGADKNEGADLSPCRFFERIAAAAQRPRISGSAALDICDVARGAADAYFEPSIYLWDIAAADLLVRRAGGETAVLRRDTALHMAFLAGTPRVFDALNTLLAPEFACPEPCR